MEDLELGQSLPLLLTPEGYKRLKEELRRLTHEKRAEIAERIRASKDHGEFSEDNSELDEVKVEQAIVEGRISDLKAIFANAEILNEAEIPTDRVGLGSVVTVRDLDHGDTFAVRLVSAVESNPDEELISDESPMGQSLIGKKVGDKAVFVAPIGTIQYEVLSITRY